MGQQDFVAFHDALDEASRIVRGAKEQDRDLTEPERTQVEQLTARAEQAKGLIDRQEKDDTLALRLSSLLGDGESDAPEPEAKTLGEAFTSAPEFVAWMKSFPGGELPETLKGFRSPTVSMGAKFINTIDLGTADGNAGAFPSEQRMGVLVPEPWPRGIEGLIALYSRGTTTASLIHYAVEDWTNAAAFVEEATSVAPADTSGTKPMSDVTYTPATVPVSTVAHWVAATKQALSDVGQLRALIDNGLRRGLMVRIANTTLNGTGTAPEWYGLNTLAGITTQAYATSPLATVKAALGAVEDAGYDANGVVMNRADWAAIDAATPTPISDPLQNRTPNIGGVRVITTPLQPAGTAIVGDFTKAYLLDREQATVTATDSHADFFIRNLVAILGEWRGAFFVPAPAAFMKADLTP